MTIRRRRNACWIRKATGIHSQHAIIIDFPLQQWLRESDSVFLYTFSVFFILSCMMYSNCVLEHLSYKNAHLPNLRPSG